MAVWMGLDLGEKRVGVALSDEALSMAFPHTVIEFKSRKYLAEALSAIIKEYNVEKIVVGLPVTLKGEMGPAAKKIQENVAWFQTQLALPWIFWDERLTTAEVEKFLVSADVSRSRRKEVRDQLAAQRILQNYMDHERMRGEK